LKRSSNSSFGSTGEVGGVVHGFDCIDDRDGVDEPFLISGLAWVPACVSMMELDECGRLSSGDIGGVCVVWESCWRRFSDVGSLSNATELAKLSVLPISEKEDDGSSKL
jgi:hypothetical protein